MPLMSQHIDVNVTELKIKVPVKLLWNTDQSHYEIVCGSTYIGTASTIEGAEAVFHSWFNGVNK